MWRRCWSVLMRSSVRVRGVGSGLVGPRRARESASSKAWSVDGDGELGVVWICRLLSLFQEMACAG